MKAFSKSQKGFTLVEVIVVAVIVAILAAIGIPIYNNYVQDAAENAAQSTASSAASFLAAARAGAVDFDAGVVNDLAAGQKWEFTSSTAPAGTKDLIWMVPPNASIDVQDNGNPGTLVATVTRGAANKTSAIYSW